MFNLPTAADLKAMNDEDVQKILDSLASRETQFLSALRQLLDTSGFKIEGTVGSVKVSLVVQTVPKEGSAMKGDAA